MYSLLDKDSNIVSAIRFARREYGKFKRSFLQIANNLGWQGPVKEHVDRILVELNKDKILNNHNKEFININNSEIVENRYLYEITYIFSNLIQVMVLIFSYLLIYRFELLTYHHLQCYHPQYDK